MSDAYGDGGGYYGGSPADNPNLVPTSGSSWSPSSSDLLRGGALAVGAAGLGTVLARGPGSLPQPYLDLEGNIPQMTDEARLLEGQGGALVGQGTEALRMAQRGELTPEQQATINNLRTTETNKARQMYASMGRNPDQDTAYLATTQDIDAKVNAAAQEQIRSTIALGLGELSSGSSLIGQGFGFQSAANQALIAAGEAQVRLDQQYSSSLTSAFTAIGTLFGGAAGAMVGGPAGAVAGATAGRAAGGAVGSAVQ